MKKTVKRIRIPEKVIDHYRKKYEGISLQKFVELALDNQVLSDCHLKKKCLSETDHLTYLSPSPFHPDMYQRYTVEGVFVETVWIV